MVNFLILIGEKISKKIALIVLFFTLQVTFLVTYFVWQGADTALVQAQQVQLENRASEISSAILERIHVYEHMLRGGVGLFVASEKVTRTEWKTYVASLKIQEQYPGIQGLGYSVHIPAANLAAHLRQIRAEGFPDYALQPAGARAEYTSVIYLEPLDRRNQRAIGYDMFSETTRRAAMVRARDTGGTALTAKVTLVQEDDKDQKQMQAGMLMLLPYYKNGMPHHTLAERRANLAGYVYSPFRLNDLMRGILKKKPTDAAESDIDIEVYDGTREGTVYSADSLLYDDDGTPHALGKPPAGRLTLTKKIDLYGHTWSLYFSTRPAFHAAFDQNKPLLILLYGTLLGVVFSGLIWLFAIQRRRELALASHLAAENTERKQAEAELLRFKNVLDNTLDMIFMFAPDTLRFAYVNQGAILSLGYSREELLAMTPYQIKPLMPEPQFRQMIAPLLAGEQSLLRFETLLRRKDGSDFSVNILLQLVKQSDGSSLFVAIVRDTTERLRVATALRASEARYRLLVQNSPYCIHEIDKSGQLISMNPAGLVMMCVVNESEIRGMRYLDAVAASDQDRISGLLDLALQGQSSEFEFFATNNCHFQSSFVPILDEAGVVQRLMGITQDITERKRIAAELQIERAKATHNAKLASLGEMSAGVAHEINNPLAIIAGNLSLLTRFKDNPKKFAAKLAAMQKATFRIDKIVKGLKKFSRSSEGEVHKTEALKDIIAEVLLLTEAKAKRHSTSVASSTEEGLNILCDVVEIEQVLINLINNAIEAIEANEAVKNPPEKWVKLNSYAEAQYIVLQVMDSGPGISEAVELKIFEPFFTTKPVGEGTGLGLSISKGILDQHHATIKLNRSFANTCFEIRFLKA